MTADHRQDHGYGRAYLVLRRHIHASTRASAVLWRLRPGPTGLCEPVRAQVSLPVASTWTMPCPSAATAPSVPAATSTRGWGLSVDGWLGCGNRPSGLPHVATMSLVVLSIVDIIHCGLTYDPAAHH